MARYFLRTPDRTRPIEWPTGNKVTVRRWSYPPCAPGQRLDRGTRADLIGGAVAVALAVIAVIVGFALRVRNTLGPHPRR